jgi:hypothetical protein
MAIEMVSSDKLSQELGVKHKQVKKWILQFKINAVPGGLKFIDDENQRVVVVNRNLFDTKLSSGAKTLSRGKKKG